MKENQEREREVQSVLGVLRAPKASDLARTRKISANSGDKTKSTSAAYGPKHISAKQRIEEFKNKSLMVIRGNEIFCHSYKEKVAVKKSNLGAHLSSKKHKLNKNKRAKTNKREEEIANAWCKYDEEKHPVGETLPTSTRVFRVKVVQSFLKSGTPINRLEYFRDLSEEAGMPLTSTPSMRQLIPFILEEEYKSVAEEAMGQESEHNLCWYHQRW